jgi:hypothetical protein
VASARSVICLMTSFEIYCTIGIYCNKHILRFYHESLTGHDIKFDLGSSSNYYRRTYTQYFYRTYEYSLSDDRSKTDETLVENATETLLKLKPQTYNKHSFVFDKFTDEEYTNVSSDNTVFSAHSNCWAEQTELIENTTDEREEFPYIHRRLTEQSQKGDWVDRAGHLLRLS